MRNQKEVSQLWSLFLPPQAGKLLLEDRLMTLFSHVLFTEEENTKKQGRSSGKEGPIWSTWT